MLEILKFEVNPSYSSIGDITIRYYDLMLFCELCVYKDEHLWIRMPEVWVNEKTKKNFNSWISKDTSKEFQKVILKKLFDMVGFTLEEALRIRKDFFKKKRMTLKIKKHILSKKKL